MPSDKFIRSSLAASLVALIFVATGFAKPADAMTQDSSDSIWARQQAQSFSALFAGSHYDWIFAPIQIQGQGFDRVQRSLMSADLASAVEREGVRVPDVELLERVVGDGRRTYPSSELDLVAEAIGAARTVIPIVGHDGAGNLSVTLEVRVRTHSGGYEATRWTATPRKFSDQQPPMAAFSAVIPELLGHLGIAPQAHTQVAGNEPLRLPANPQALVKSDAGGPIADAARFAVLGELSAPGSRAAERLFVKSLLAVRQAPQSPAQSFLQAYTLFILNMRPAALAAAEAGKSPALRALLAIINGKLGDAQTLVRATSGYEKLILELRLNDFQQAARHYENQDRMPLPPEAAQLAAQSSAWRVFLDDRWNYYQPGDSESNVVLERLLDRWYPLAGQSFEELVGARTNTPGVSLQWTDVELSAYEHIRHLMTSAPEMWCCSMQSLRPKSADLLAVVESWSEVNVGFAVRLVLERQGLPDRAEQMLVALDEFYAGHPDFELLHAQANDAMARQVTGARNRIFQQAAQEHALRALAAAGGQSYVAIMALQSLQGNTTATGIARNYDNDLPRFAGWHSPDAVIDPNAKSGLAQPSLTSNDTTAVLAELRGRLRSEPDNWDVRSELAQALVERDDVVGAARVFLGFPAFHLAQPADPIALAEHAAEAGHSFFWRGYDHQARQLYAVATRYHVGSEAQMTAATRMSLLGGDLTGALRQAQLRADRYPGADSYRHYLSLMHVLGRSKEAWRSFNLLLDRPWRAALAEPAMVGQRIAGMKPDDLLRWLAQPEMQRSITPRLSWPAEFLLVWTATDRVAGADLDALVGRLAHEPRGVTEDNSGRTSSYPLDSGGRFLVIRSTFREAQRQSLASNTPVESDQVLFARALIPLQQSDFPAAVSRFDELSARYAIETRTENADAVYALPEFAYSSAKAGDRLGLEAFVESRPVEAQFFEMSLARAYFLALVHHDNDAALKRLQAAWSSMEHYMGRTPSQEYQYANAAERLFRDTGDERFRQAALRWCRIVQHVQPWNAWSYTMDVSLTPDPVARRRALVKALFLDSLSPRLRSIPAAELESAKAELQGGNPFLTPAAPLARPGGINSTVRLDFSVRGPAHRELLVSAPTQ